MFWFRILGYGLSFDTYDKFSDRQNITHPLLKIGRLKIRWLKP